MQLTCVKAMHIADKYGLIAPVCDQPQYNAFERHIEEADYMQILKLYKYVALISLFTPNLI